jgi:hypothetical protein
MMKICKNIMAALAMTVLLVGLTGCVKEGPVERTGKKIDKAVEKGGQQVDKAGKKIKEEVTGK